MIALEGVQECPPDDPEGDELDDDQSDQPHRGLVAAGIKGVRERRQTPPEMEDD